ncbi:MAG: type II secretion system protein GspD [Gammaproteobacteria bacterium]|nr:MAG: type II secretion system protein GspD [Gammaproteobacteria bacterium]
MRSLSHTLFAPLATLLLCVVLGGSNAMASESQSWKINLKNADIQEFVAQIAAITGRTFVVDPRVKGKVTVISNASLDEAGIYELFLSVLRVHGFAAIEAGEVVRIQQQTLAKQSGSPLDSAQEISGEQLVTRVIAAQYVASAELVKTLRPMIPQYGHIAAVTQPNVVIISDHAANIVRLMKIIARIDVADEEEIVVIPLKEAWVGTIVELLEKLAPEELGRNAKGPQSIQVIANERNNSIVLRGKSRPIAQVRKLISMLDQPATSGGTTQVIYLAHSDAASVAQILTQLVGDQRAEGAPAAEVKIQADESLNALVIKADPTTMNEIMSIVRMLDVRRTQVLIEAAIVEISLDADFELGVEMAAIDRGNSSIPFFSTALSPTLAQILGGLGPGDGEDGPFDPAAVLGVATQPTLGVGKLDPDGFSFAVILRAIASSSAANLLSTPSILTLDNEEAKILVGQEVPFRTGSFTTTADGANNPFQTIQREDVGITLTVTPHIHDGTALRLEISQEVSSVVLASLLEGSPGIITNKRTIDTTILAEDRQTIVLGGLIQDDIQHKVRKVPLLGDIPWLGRLFRVDEETHDKRSLLVFLRATILHDPSEVTEVTQRKYDSIWDVEIQSRTLKTEDPVQPPLDTIYDGRLQ